jgi:hypothetical protein
MSRFARPQEYEVVAALSATHHENEERRCGIKKE